MATTNSTFQPVGLAEDSTKPVVNTFDAWKANYKEAFLEHFYDSSQLTLIHPDDCLIVAGPARLKDVTDNSKLHIIGFANSFAYNNQRTVNPAKTIGSRRHIFAATGQPVSGSIDRMLIIGRNLLNSLYANMTVGSDILARNTKYVNGKSGAVWFTNIEEDLFRIPFGLGVIYNSPASLAGKSDASKDGGAADYLEVCTITSRGIQIQAGGTTLAEHVEFAADRVIPWLSYSALQESDLPKLATVVSSMDGTTPVTQATQNQ